MDQVFVRFFCLLVFYFCFMFSWSEAGPYIVGATYYPWYGGTENPHWPEGVSNKPWIGYYYSGDPAVVKQQIDLANQYGVNVFAVSWTGINTSSEKKFRTGFLKASNVKQIQFCIYYETFLRFGERSDPVDLNFNNPILRELFITDLEYLARTYFSHPSYFKIQGRPVVHFYLARRFKGEFPSVLEEAKRRLKSMGWNPYFIGDSLFYDRNDLYIVSQFDAATSYSFFSPRLISDGIDTSGKFALSLRPLFWHILYQLRDLRVGGTDHPIDFQPAVIPQFDNTLQGKRGGARLLAQSKEEVKRVFQVGRDLLKAKPLGQKIVWITSWNEWHEGTAIEPTVTGGPRYPGGNHGFDFLEAVAEVFR